MRGTGLHLPGGDLTFVFTDIEGSTELLRRVGDDRYADLQEVHDRLLRDCWTRHSGIEVGNEGDSFFVVFTEAHNALAACGDAQAALASEVWAEGVQLAVRMGIHSGLAQPRNSDYASLTVNQTARVMAAASGSQVLFTTNVVERLKRDGAQTINLRGKYRVRDFDTSIELYELVGDTWQANDAAPRVPSSETHNLVVPGTSLIGRDEELKRVPALIEPGSLTTLVGPGGVGKTRIAIEIGLRIAPKWPDGAWFAALESSETPEAMMGAVADALGVSLHKGSELIEELVAQCGNRSALLILDNCEHVLDTCAELAARLLRDAPGCAVVATSRTSLGLMAERVWRLAPLDTSPNGGSVAHSVQLFRDRSELGSSPAVASSNDDIAALCVRLDGLPLAIELAAASAHRMPLSAMTQALERGVALPETRDPDVPARHRSLDSVLSWGHDLLDESARRLLASVSDLPAGFDLEIAAAALGAADEREIPLDQAAWSLVDNSLIAVDRTSRKPRYHTRALVRSFTIDRTDPGNRQLQAGRLIRFFLGKVGPQCQHDRAWASAVADDLDNLRRLATIDSDASLSERRQVIWTVGRYLDMTDQFAVAIAELSVHVDRPAEPTPELVAIQALIADVHLRTGHLLSAETAIAAAERTLALVGPVSWDDVCVARTRGDIAMRRGEFDNALQIANEALNAQPSVRGAARLWNLVGLTQASANAPAEAEAAFERELELWRELGFETAQATTYGNLAEVALRAGDGPAAARYQLGCLELAMELGQPVLFAFSIVVAARLAARGGHWVNAARLQGAADSALESYGYALYDSDISERSAMLVAAGEHLSASELERHGEAGANIDLGTASDEAAEFLRSLINSGGNT